MEGFMRKSSKLVGLAGAVLALSLLAGCSVERAGTGAARSQRGEPAPMVRRLARRRRPEVAGVSGPGSGGSEPRRAGGQRREGGCGPCRSDRVEDDVGAPWAPSRRIAIMGQRRRQLLKRLPATGATGATGETGATGATGETCNRRIPARPARRRTCSCYSVISHRLDSNEGGCLCSRPRLTWPSEPH